MDDAPDDPLADRTPVEGMALHDGVAPAQPALERQGSWLVSWLGALSSTGRRVLALPGAELVLTALGCVAVAGLVLLAVKSSSPAAYPLKRADADWALAATRAETLANAVLDAAPDDESPVRPARPRMPSGKSAAPSGAGRTLVQAAATSCSTKIVAGLSRQIIEEARCLNPHAFVRVPQRSNLVAGGNVLLYLEAPARDRLLRALDAHPELTMTVNSALRTVAQQLLLAKWGETRRCGVKLAASPGDSNHESGLAIDIREASAWRKALEAEGFRWMGRLDPVHFDYRGPGAVDHRGLDVRAFQRLWTRNFPNDPLAETGRLDARTAARLARAPAAGFRIGARCPR